MAVASPFDIALGTVGGVDRGNIQFGTFFRGLKVLNTDKQFQLRINSQLTQRDQFSARFLSDSNIIPFGGTIGSFTYVRGNYTFRGGVGFLRQTGKSSATN